MNDLIWLTIAVVAALALILSVINAIRITKWRRQLEVDVVNHREDVNLSMESVKYTATREVKNLRKEINKRNKPAPQRKKPVAKTDGADNVTESSDSADEKSATRRNPNANRQRNYRPKKKPILKKPEDSVSNEE